MTDEHKTRINRWFEDERVNEHAKRVVYGALALMAIVVVALGIRFFGGEYATVFGLSHWTHGVVVLVLVLAAIIVSCYSVGTLLVRWLDD